ncbi:MAG: hypothetical protein GY828_08375 [Candidatus Gracilibacteria bacterium]|nr:hypothetical protein [Candidatus Gracilibacteria bacterium]
MQGGIKTLGTRGARCVPEKKDTKKVKVIITDYNSSDKNTVDKDDKQKS